jgi:GT2 family glycosyltransferase
MQRIVAASGVEIALGADGSVRATVPAGRWRENRSAAGMVLDGTLRGTADLRIEPDGRCALHGRLPDRLLFAELDLIDLADGTSLLGVPVSLAATTRLGAMEVGQEACHLTGGFSAAAFFAPEIGIDWIHDRRVVARGIAVREDEGGGEMGRWRFRVPLLSLPRLDETWTARPRIGGMELAGPAIAVNAGTAGMVGCLDAASPNHVEGWAVNLRAQLEPVRLEVTVDGRVVLSLLADLLRPDIAALGLGGGRCGFAAELPAHPDPDARRRIGVRVEGTRSELAGSPVMVDPVPGLIGCFDTLHGMCVHGWALDREHPDVPVRVEVVGPGGEVVGSGTASHFRGDLLDAGLNAGVCAFMIDISAHFDQLIDKEVVVRIAGTESLLAGSPQRVAINRNLRKFLNRRQIIKPGVLSRLRRALTHRAGEAGISFIMPVHNTPRLWLIEALESVRAQFCDAWELICVDDGSTAAHVGDILASYAARDPRVRVLTSARNVGIAGAVNFGLRAARHDHVAFIDHDDRLEPDAAWQLIRAARQTGADLLYSDEALTGENIEAVTELRLRPAFSHDYYLSHPYFVHLVCARTEVARRIGGWDERMAISADIDFVLRMIEASAIICHVPAILYRWRTHGGSTGHARQAAVMEATIGALQRHLDRLGTGARAGAGVWFNQFRIDWPEAAGKILIVIPTKNKAELLRTAVESIERTSAGMDYRLVVIDHESTEASARALLSEIARRHVVMPYAGAFNFSRMNNLAVAAHGADAAFVLFLNNDVEALQDGWLDRLRRIAGRADVGAVGPLLMYGNRTVQHAGVILGFGESADHAHKFQPVFLDDQGRRNLGYNCCLTAVRDYEAVTGACLMLRRAVFDQVGGFDEGFGIGFNDTDLCLRIRAAGLRVLYDGETILYHHESATRSETQQVLHPEDTRAMIARWGHKLKSGDPFYHPNLALKTQDHVLREDAGCRAVQAPRATPTDLARLAAARAPGRAIRRGRSKNGG